MDQGPSQGVTRRKLLVTSAGGAAALMIGKLPVSASAATSTSEAIFVKVLTAQLGEESPAIEQRAVNSLKTLVAQNGEAGQRAIALTLNAVGKEGNFARATLRERRSILADLSTGGRPTSFKPDSAPAERLDPSSQDQIDTILKAQAEGTDENAVEFQFLPPPSRFPAPKPPARFPDLPSDVAKRKLQLASTLSVITAFAVTGPDTRTPVYLDPAAEEI